MTAFRVSIVRPHAYLHSEAFREVAESLHFTLLRLGHESAIVENRLDDDAQLILLGAHLLDRAGAEQLPDRAILYNLEQLNEEFLGRTPVYAELLRRCTVWDYSARNLQFLSGLGVTAKHLPVGYVPELTRIGRAATPDIDVLFYGSVNERRRAVLQELSDAGLKVTSVFGEYGPGRDELIARAKIVLNVHFYATRILEMARISYLLANGVAVLCEADPESEIDERVRGCVALADRDGLTDAALELAYDDERRLALGRRALEEFMAHPLLDDLRPLVGTAGAPGRGIKYPLRMNLGSGRDWRQDYLNCDIGPQWLPDFVLDIAAPLDLPRVVETERFGRMALCEGSLEEIIANDVLEHVSDLMATMTNCLRLLKVGGHFRIQVPYDLSYGAWQDPTHVRAFNERSWLYYCDWFWYMGWQDYRFELVKLNYVLSPLGRAKHEAGLSIDEITLLPRAVDHMHVVLRKRMLTEDERRLVAERAYEVGSRAAGRSPYPSEGPRA